MSLFPHKLSHCCHVPVLGNGNGKRGICSNCNQPCKVDLVDDGERAYRLKLLQIKRKSIAEVTKQVIVTGFDRMDKKLTIRFTDRACQHSYCTVNNADFMQWASANSYVALLPEVQYVDGQHWDKQPHELNRKLNATEMVRFYNSIDKAMLEKYLNEKLINHYATAI